MNSPNKEFYTLINELYLKNGLSNLLLSSHPEVLLTNFPPKISGDILEEPDLIWAEDHWDDVRISEANQKLKSQGNPCINEYWRNRYCTKAGLFWHEFYKRNNDHFYKDRHYLHIVFPELAENKTIALAELGSGVGNAIWPLLELNENLIVYAFDFAKSAIEIMHNNHLYKEFNRKYNDNKNDDENKKPQHKYRVLGQVCDLVNDDIPIEPDSIDYALCMFSLSAIAPEAHQSVFSKINRILKKGGKLFIRDYGRFDEAQLRFSGKNKIEENFYVRQDGTCAYYFSTEDIKKLASASGFSIEANEYILRQYANRKQGKARYRVWVHCKLIKV